MTIFAKVIENNIVVQPVIQTTAAFLNGALGAAEESATAAAASAELADQAATRAVALLQSRFGLPGLAVDFITNSSVLTTTEVTSGTAMDPLTFARASSTIEVSGGVFATFASGVPALTPEGLAIRPLREQLNEYAQDLSQAATWPLVNTTVASAGVGPLGTNIWTVANTTGTGLHSIRQTENPVDLTPHTLVAVWKPRATSTFSFGLGAAFGTGMIVNLSTSGATTSKAEITNIGTVALPDGLYLSWGTAIPATTGASAQLAYVKNSASYTGAGESIDIVSFEFYKGDSPVFPIMTPGTAAVTRAADVVYFDTTGTEHTFGARFITNAMRSPSGYRLLLGTATNHIAVLQNAGKLELRVVVSGTTTTTIVGPNVTTDDQIGVVYSETTRALSWAVNGIMQAGAIGGPTGLSRVYLGSDAAGARQVNGKVAWFEVLRGLSAKLLSGTGGLAEDGAAAFDTTQIVVIPSATEILIGHHLPGGANDDWLWRGIERREQLAFRSVGWARGRVFHAKRTGPTSFGTIIKTVINANTANDDSWKISGTAASEFNAIMNAPSQHGFLEGTDITFSLDGVPFDPATSPPLVGGRFKAVQNCIALNPLTCLRGEEAAQFDTTGKWADWRMEWIISAADQLLYTPRKVVTVTTTCTNACYENMAQLVNDGTVFSKAVYREGSTDIITGVTTDATTADNWMREHGDTYECRVDWVSGFTGTAKIFVQNSDASSAKHKIYCQHRTDATFTLTAGTVIQSTFQEQFNLR